MKSGKKGRVVEVSGGKVLENRLMSMGVYLGKDITKISHFAMKGPVTIRAGRTVVALGHSMAHKISVEIE